MARGLRMGSAVINCADLELMTRFWCQALGLKPGPMPRARVLLLCEDAGGAIVYGYAADGTFAGDTWFESTDVARDAFAQRYPEHLGPWRTTHEPVDTAVMTALREASRSGDAR